MIFNRRVLQAFLHQAVQDGARHREISREITHA
jgi:hypothetical protein